MADSSSEKTEKPTPKRLRDARKKGQVAKSTELNSAFVLLAMLGALWLGGGAAMESLRALVAEALHIAFAPDFWEVLPGLMERAGVLLLVGYAVIFVSVGCLAALICRLQVGSIFSMDPVMPKLERVNPAAGLKRIFSKKTLANFVMSLVKTTVLAGVVWGVTRASLADVLHMPVLTADYIALVAGVVVMRLLASAWLVSLVSSSVDLLLQRHWFVQDLKMAKHEVKRDHKESEGNPEVKSQRRSMALEMLFEEMEEKVSKASVVVVNPTHLAVALVYRPGETDLPKVVAKGGDDMALMIRNIARKHGVPVVRNVPLAHDLYKTPLNEYIGRDLFEPVARLLLWVRSVEAQHAAERGEGQG